MRREGREQQLCFLKLHPAQEDEMTELEMKTEAEVEDFTDELSDEALDRAEGACCACNLGATACFMRLTR
jgi:hypothetical protein